jgi:hypothetical protein
MILGHNAQKKAARENKKFALKNLSLMYDDLDARAAEEAAAASQATQAVETDAGSLEGSTAVSAASGNVAGATVDALLHDVARQEAQAKMTIATNLENTLGQVQRQKRGAVAMAEQQIAAVKPPSDLGLALNLAGVGIGAYNQYNR